MANKQKSGSISKRMQQRAEERRKKRMTTTLIVAAALIIVLAGVLFVVFNNNNAPSEASVGSIPMEVNVEEAYQLVEDGAFLLDVRTQEEWDEFHAPQATLIPLDELVSRVSEVPSDQEIVVICRSGNRSLVGRDTLLDAGFTNVTSVDGGMNEWRSAGYPTE
ncbi:MAG: rhodanese-like domain-containing protein [Anaerolineales bacterium]|jgi:rhodanese-related sulfurtransferase